MPHCRICAATTGFIKTHIIPEAFFRELRECQVAPLLVAGVKGELPKKSPIGVYDSELLCANCESKFGRWDDYGIERLLTRFDNYFNPLVADGRVFAHEAIEIDKLEILDFLVSILWRASVSNHPFYKTVNLGPHEHSVLTDMLIGKEHSPDSFDAVLSRWSDDDDQTLPTNALMNPHRERWGEVNAYRLYLGKIVAYVRVDQRPFVEPFANFSLRTLGPCRVISRRLATSNDLKAMRKTIVVAERNRQEFKRSFGS